MLNAHTRQTGIALLEVLVAFLILSLSMGAIMQSVAASARQQRVVEDRITAVEHAASVLTRIGIDIPLKVGQQSGQLDERFSWQITISNIDKHGSMNRKREQPVLSVLDVELSIAWRQADRTRELVVNTKRLRRRE